MKMQGEKLSKENIDSAYVNKTFKLIHYIDQTLIVKCFQNSSLEEIYGLRM